MEDTTGTAVVGRERELRAFGQRLERRASALILIAARPGMGKSTLVELLERSAREHGWRTAHGEELRVGPDTTVAGFRAAVLDRLGLPAHGGLAAEGGDFRVEPRAPRSWTGVTPGTTSSARPSDPLVDLLERRAGRYSVFVDGFRPSRRMAAWFAGTFVPSVQRGHTPVLVVVADTTTALGPLVDIATHVHELGPPDRESIREYLEEAGARPALSRKELAAYEEAVLQRPELLHTLGRLLALTGVEDAPGPGPFGDSGGSTHG